MKSEQEKRILELEYSINKQLRDIPDRMVITTSYGDVPLQAGDAEVIQKLLKKRFVQKIRAYKINT